MTDESNQEITQLKQTLQSLQIERLALDQAYLEEIRKNVAHKGQIIVLSSQLEEAKKALQPK